MRTSTREIVVALLIVGVFRFAVAQESINFSTARGAPFQAERITTDTFVNADGKRVLGSWARKRLRGSAWGGYGSPSIEGDRLTHKFSSTILPSKELHFSSHRPRPQGWNVTGLNRNSKRPARKSRGAHSANDSIQGDMARCRQTLCSRNSEIRPLTG
jgi:hypothetical protein